MKKLLPFVLLIAVSACGNNKKDDDNNTSAGGPETRDQRIALVSSEACERHEMCGHVGDGKAFADMAACLSDRQEKYGELWPKASCGDDAFNAGRYDKCRTQSRNFLCNADPAQLENLISNCSAADMCS